MQVSRGVTNSPSTDLHLTIPGSIHEKKDASSTNAKSSHSKSARKNPNFDVIDGFRCPDIQLGSSIFKHAAGLNSDNAAPSTR